MAQSIMIQGTELQRLMYKGEPVVTLAMIDKLHNRAEDTARKTFNRNRDRFEDVGAYFKVPYEEWRQILDVRLTDDQSDFSDASEGKGGHRGNMIFLTQVGYLMVIKSFNDDLAWDIYIEMVRCYFDSKVKMGSKKAPNAEYLGWLKEQRLSMQEERKFQEFALSEADRLIRQRSSADDLGHVPLLRDAVDKIMRNDPRTKQLPLFQD